MMFLNVSLQGRHLEFRNSILFSYERSSSIPVPQMAPGPRAAPSDALCAILFAFSVLKRMLTASS